MLQKRFRLSKPAWILIGTAIVCLSAGICRWLTAPLSGQAQLDYQLATAIEADDVGNTLAALQAGANVNSHIYARYPPSRLVAAIYKRHTPALYAAYMWPQMWGDGVGSKSLQQPGLLKVLLEHGADPNTCDDEGLTPLIMAVQERNSECVGLLLKYGANPNARDKEGLTAFLWAALLGDSERVRLLLPRTTNIDAADNMGRTSLMLAIEDHAVDCVQILLDAHADVNRRDKKGYTALDMAIEKDNETDNDDINDRNKVAKNTTLEDALWNTGAKTGKELDAQAVTRPKR